MWHSTRNIISFPSQLLSLRMGWIIFFFVVVAPFDGLTFTTRVTD